VIENPAGVSTPRQFRNHRQQCPTAARIARRAKGHAFARSKISARSAWLRRAPCRSLRGVLFGQASVVLPRDIAKPDQCGGMHRFLHPEKPALCIDSVRRRRCGTGAICEIGRSQKDDSLFHGMRI
jgi:hypothetical protein